MTAARSLDVFPEPAPSAHVVRDPFSPEGLALIQERLGITPEEFLAGVDAAEAEYEALPAEERAEHEALAREVRERQRSR